jgi:TonB-like protein
MRTTSILLLALASMAAPAAIAAQTTNPDSAHIDTTFVTSKDISPPRLIACPTPPHVQPHGIVQVSMIIDTLGHPEPASVKILTSDDDSLSAVALRTAPECRFKPGKYHRHKIRIAIALPFIF